MPQNPEYKEWLSWYRDSLKKDPHLPYMQPNPEYFKWLAERDSLKNTDPRKAPSLAVDPDAPELTPYQINRPKRDIVLGLAFTGTGYYGDLNYSPNGLFDAEFFSFHPGFMMSLRRDAPKWILPSFSIGYGKFVAQNGDLPPTTLSINDVDTTIQANTFAETDLIHGDFQLTINLLRKASIVRPYLAFGIGGMAFFPRAQDGVLLFRKRSTRAPNEPLYGTLTLSFPFSTGVDITLHRTLSMQVGYTYRLSNTDYLDNIGLLGRQAGNDQLHSFQIGLNFRIFDASRYEVISQ